jgi:FMN phosphatase YigB (HAD superfamily)
MKTILVDAINTLVIKDQGVFADMRALLDQYPNPKLVVTNADDEEMKTYGLDSLPYEVFTLKHLPEKTDWHYFQSLLQLKGLTADGVVYFEHNPAAVESARSMGITSFRYDPDKKDLAALKNFLDSNL